MVGVAAMGLFFRCYECVILPWFAKRQMADTALKTTEVIVVFCGWFDAFSWNIFESAWDRNFP